DDGTRNHRCADIVGKRIGGERADGDEGERYFLAQMQKRDVVVAGQRHIGEERTCSGEQPAMQGDCLQPVADILERDAAQFMIEQPYREGDGTKPDDGPQIGLQLHRAMPCSSPFSSLAGMPPAPLWLPPNPVSAMPYRRLLFNRPSPFC